MLVAAAALALLPAAASSAESRHRADAHLDRALHRLVERSGGPPGAATIVDRRGQIEFHRAGVGLLSNGRPIRRRDHFRIASVAKAFSGAVGLGLVDRGVLSVDSTIGEVLPSLPAAWSNVTLGQALNHTSGLPDYIKSQAFIDRFAADPRQYFSPEQLIEFVADMPLAFAPGSEYEYSDTDNIVVGLMAETATGRPYERLLSQLVYGQLGMRSTSLPAGYLMPRPFAHGYDVEENPPENVSQLLSASGPWASGGIVSTLPDLNRFIRGYGGGSILSAPVRARQLEFVPGGESGPPGPGANAAGMGIFRYETDCGTVYGHTGNMPGYTAFIAASPNGRRSVAFAINTQLNPRTSHEAFDRLRRVEELAVCAALA